MSFKPIICYTFYEYDVLDSLARMTWKELFRKHPDLRETITEEIKNSFHPEGINGCKPTSLNLSEVFNAKTISWTLRRSYSQFFTISICFELILALHARNISTYYVGDSDALVAAGIDCWERGVINEATLRAILKIHSFDSGSLHVLNLPKGTIRKIKQLAWWYLPSKPLFPWQGLKWQSNNFDFVDNCLKVLDTSRFVKFLQLAWRDNQPVPYIEILNEDWPLSVKTDPLPRFRELELNRKLMAEHKKILRLKRPCLIRIVNDG